MPEKDFPLPPGLPVPVDDGAASHLFGLPVPNIPLRSTLGRLVDLSAQGKSRVVAYCYPMTGVPGKPLPEGWNEIPGARGCTPQTSGFRDHFTEFRARNVGVFGLSTQTTEYQKEMAERLAVPFEVLSDSEYRLTDALHLPTFEVEGKRLIKRLTLVIRDGKIEHVFYPVFPPDKSAEQILGWLDEHPFAHDEQ
jgi:peroxiredoxin